MKTFTQNQVVKFQFGRNNKTTLTGRIVSEGFKCAYIQVERVSGKFARQDQKNTLCIRKDQIIR